MRFTLENGQIETQCVTDQETAAAICLKARPSLGKAGRRAQHLSGNAVNGGGTWRDGDTWVDQCLENIARLQQSVHQRHTAKLQDACFLHIKTGGLGVESHRVGSNQGRGVGDRSHNTIQTTGQTTGQTAGQTAGQSRGQTGGSD